jgi:hypothetical protein
LLNNFLDFRCVSDGEFHEILRKPLEIEEVRIGFSGGPTKAITHVPHVSVCSTPSLSARLPEPEPLTTSIFKVLRLELPGAAILNFPVVELAE